LISFDADPNDNFTLAYNIATQGTSFYQSVDDRNGPVCVPSSLLPSRWPFGVMCRQIVVSMSAAKELTVWIRDTLELEFDSRRCEMYEAALLQFAALVYVDALRVKEWGRSLTTRTTRMLAGTRSTGRASSFSMAWRR
jgi:hypothetical protein